MSGHEKGGDMRVFLFYFILFVFFVVLDTFRYHLLALALGLTLGGAGASFFTFGAIFTKHEDSIFFFNYV